MYDFDKGIVRKNTNCIKWDSLSVGEDVIPMWIADMDFEISPHITKRLQKTALQGVFGYQFLSNDYYNAVVNWMDRNHNYKIEKDWICYVPNVVAGLSCAVQAVTDYGDEIIIQTPVYGPFFQVIKDNGRILVESKLKNENGYYTMDFEDLQKKITKKTKAIILCNPHNPSGRVWTRDELKELADICLKNEIFIISDDIHCELVTKNHEHTVIATISKEISKNSIICTSPSKAFNLASLHVANCLIENDEVRDRFKEILSKLHMEDCNAFAETALIGAYEESEQWLKELNSYIEDNMDYFVDYVQKHIPKLTVYKPEGTYLVWVDFRNIEIEQVDLREFLINKCNVVVNDGKVFGDNGNGFTRFNLACPRENITKVLEKLKKQFSKI